MLVPSNEINVILKKYEDLWTKIWDLIRSRTNNSDDFDEKYENQFFSDHNLPLKKTLELRNMIIVVRSVFHDSSKYCPHFF